MCVTKHLFDLLKPKHHQLFSPALWAGVKCYLNSGGLSVHFENNRPPVYMTHNSECSIIQLYNMQSSHELSNREIELGSPESPWTRVLRASQLKNPIKNPSHSLITTLILSLSQQKVLGGDFFNKVCGHLKLLEKEYFGLEFRHHSGNYVRKI